MITITSAENAAVKHIKNLYRHTYRARVGEAVLEGARFVTDSVKNGAVLTAVYVREGYSGALPPCEKTYVLSPRLFDRIATTETPQGILAAARIAEADAVPEDGLLLVCDNVRDPGNMGTIIRTAHAVDAAGVVLLKGCVDYTNPKVMRATMGSVFAVPIVRIDTLAPLKNRKIFGGALAEDAKLLYDVQFPENAAIVVGNEGDGISEEVLQDCDQKVIIPMPGGVESLNAAVACSVLAYEYLRQRLKGG